MGCTLQEAFDMTWSEFQIRKIGLDRVRKWEMRLFREISYEVHTLKYLFSKKRPPKKAKFWPIDEELKTGSQVSGDVRKAYLERFKEYIKQKAEHGHPVHPTIGEHPGTDPRAEAGQGGPG